MSPEGQEIVKLGGPSESGGKGKGQQNCGVWI